MKSTTEPACPHPAATPIIEAHDVTAGYHDLIAVREVSVTVGPGEIVALFGPNGSGKTTLLLSAVGAIPLASGTYWWDGAPLTGPVHRRARMGLGFVPEDRSVVTELTVRANLDIGRGRTDAAVTIFPELKPLLDRRAGLLSGGEQQMLVLARQLAAEPSCILIDELSLGLAPRVVDRLFEVLRERADSSALGVLLVEQQARRALAVIDRWYLLKGGRLRHEGSSTDTAALETAYFS